jgi:8-amino-7-oxononanoate synthase
VSVHVGGESEALAASAALLRDGFHVPAIRPPTVPAGTCRLRVALSAAHSAADVAALAAALRRCGVLEGALAHERAHGRAATDTDAAPDAAALRGDAAPLLAHASRL